MCLIAVALGVDERWPLVIAANRDEFHHRPSAQADWWEGQKEIFGGRDLSAGGTWLALGRSGRLGALTNYRDPPEHRAVAPRSRGELVSDFIASTLPPDRWAALRLSALDQYAGFNALLFDWQDETRRPQGWYLNNRQPSSALSALTPGIHGLSNHLLGTRWPKVQRLCSALETALAQSDHIESSLFEALADRRPVDPIERAQGDPHTSEDLLLRTPFIADSRYGTRASTVVMVGADGGIRFVERSWDWHEGAPRLSGERTMLLGAQP